MKRVLSGSQGAEGRFEVGVEGVPHALFYMRLNPGSPFPPAYEVSLFSLADSLARQRRLAWRFAGTGALLLAGAFAASLFLSGRLSVPVERLAATSERNARFSADASHQLKTPVTVLRAGLEELLAGETLAPAAREEVSALVHQTFRLTGVIEDLLLLSRMDAGRLRLEFRPVNLTRLIEGWLDDLGAIPDGRDLRVEMECPPELHVAGEMRYTTLILQNLLENARKYNVPGGSIRIAGREEGEWVVLTIANTGRPIAPEAREHIFERFHRGVAGENVPGHGLGLNLARELARLHGGDLRLVRSDESGTEFEVRFRAVRAAVSKTLPAHA
jgi:signal transduction histidine kinase